jgi:uncharacterized protein
MLFLTDELLLNYLRCERRAFLNVHGEVREQGPERDFLVKLRRESNKHKQNILDQFYPIYQAPTAADWQTQAQETELLMGEGMDCIVGGVLVWQEESLALMATVDILLKQPGKSKFGDWCYVPLNIEFGRRPKSEYKIIAAFTAKILSNLQETLPEKVEIILRDSSHHPVCLSTWLPRMGQAVTECQEMLFSKREPEVFISRQRCSLCHWHRHCYGIAQSQNHLSLVPGVTPNRYEQLQSLGVETLESLASACPVHLGCTMGFHISQQLTMQAQSLVENRPISKRTSGLKIPNSAIELYFDIEAEPELNLDYLLGVLVIDKHQNKEEFYPFLAEDISEEGVIWQKFLALVKSYPHAPIFHFSNYEAETIKRLGNANNTPKGEIDSLLSRLVDLHQKVISSVILPVESYSLKSLANWLGFHWREPGVTGEQCVCWYDQWLRTGDRSLLKSICRYNEDDCRATRHLKDWLVEFFK